MGSILSAYKQKPRYIPKVVKHEENMQRMVCHYLRLQFPRVIFHSDYASGLHLTENQARINKSLQSSRSFPDLFIYEPRTVTDKDGTETHYCGMALELKKEGTTIVVTRGPRKGHLTSDPHVQEQYLMLKELARKGYYTNFAVGFDEAQKIIDWYFGKPENNSLF